MNHVSLLTDVRSRIKNMTFSVYKQKWFMNINENQAHK